MATLARMTAEMHLPTFYVQQKFAMTTNRYAIYAANPDGSFGALMGVAQQKRMAFKEQVTFYADESKTRPVFGFKARASGSTSTPATTSPTRPGQQIGFFRKDFGASLLRSTFHVEGPGYTGTGQERSQGVAAACAASSTSRSCRSTSTSSTPPGAPLLGGRAAGHRSRDTLHRPRARPAGRLPGRRGGRGRPGRPDAALTAGDRPDRQPCACTSAPTTPASTSRTTCSPG